MSEATIAITVMSGLIGISFLGFLIWGVRSGQFHNVEDAKYRLFDNHSEPDDENKTEEVTKGGDVP
jgi:cbb3-type cytochrome oxidase maturation protein